MFPGRTMMQALPSLVSFPKRAFRSLPDPALAVAGGIAAVCIAVPALHSAWIHDGLGLGLGPAGALLLLGIRCALDMGKSAVPKAAHLIPAAVMALCLGSLILG